MLCYVLCCVVLCVVLCRRKKGVQYLWGHHCGVRLKVSGTKRYIPNIGLHISGLNDYVCIHMNEKISMGQNQGGGVKIPYV